MKLRFRLSLPLNVSISSMRFFVERFGLNRLARADRLIAENQIRLRIGRIVRRRLLERRQRRRRVAAEDVHLGQQQVDRRQVRILAQRRFEELLGAERIAVVEPLDRFVDVGVAACPDRRPRRRSRLAS